MERNSEIWLHTDYEEEGVRNLEFAVEQLRLVSRDPYRWKWASLALHGSLQAFMVKACSGTDLLGAMTPAYQNDWLSSYERGTQPTKRPRLLPFMKLFESMQDLRGSVDTVSLQPTEDQKRSVRILDSWRGEFMHYKPGGISFDVSGLPGVFDASLGIIRFLALESMNVFRGESDYAQRTAGALEEAANLLGGITNAYGSPDAIST